VALTPGRYEVAGLSLLTAGIFLSLIFYLVLGSVPFTAMGLALVIVGATVALLPEEVVPRRAVKSMLRGATYGIEAMLEEFNASGKAVYAPPRDGLVAAYVPLTSGTATSSAGDSPKRMITMFGGRPALMVYPPGADVVRAAQLGDEAKLEESLQLVLADTAELCSSLRATVTGETVAMEMWNPKVKTEAPRYVSSLGSLQASLAACVIATVMKKNVVVTEERPVGKKVLATFSLGA
jgi:hypothetical protein